ncbi:MAG: tetratricopeptide repeat protein, partial [Bacteriovoracaceae bacterium]|nr:tetratricopeptide repeat protein [Bacteriovoracaceae bacterium]
QKEAEQGILEASDDVKRVFKKSLAYYNDSITGEDGKFKTPSMVSTFKINFQMARAFHKIGQLDKAVELFEKVVQMPVKSENIKREAVLNLAEVYEGKNEFTKASQNYDLALGLCNKKELCSYINYRKSWIFFKEGNIEKAISTIKLGLYDSHGSLKDQALQDYLMFTVQRATDGQKELVEFETFSKKHQRPKMMSKLMEGFFGEGNRVAGVAFLSYLNRKTPDMFSQIRLMEEYYGFRNWEKYNTYLDQALRKKTVLDLKIKQNKKIEKTMRRLVVQVDGERKQDVTRNIELKKTIDLYLGYFPNDELRDKMVNGWMAAEESEEKILAKLPEWIKSEAEFKKVKREKELRIKRISLAQKLKRNDIVLSDSKNLLPLLDEKEKREYLYLIARTQYSEKDFDNALVGFKELAKLPEGTTKSQIDKFALQAQNLALDILNQKKDYAGIQAQAASWLAVSAFKNHNEYKEMNKIASQARFEEAATKEDNPDSLATFREYCLKGEYADKSCLNAKIMALKLKNQKVLIEILTKLKDEKALIVEYEAMGEYTKAAHLLEKTQKKVKKFDLDFYLKISLFYEIDRNIKQRDRVLRKVIKWLSKQKKLDEARQALVYATLNDAGMIDSKVLRFPWSLARKMRIIHELELRGTGTKKSRKMMLSSKTSLGDKWSLAKLEKVMAAYKKQKKVKFYGRGSQRKFKRRIARLNKFVELSKGYLEGSDYKTRVIMLNLVTASYKELHDEILATPLPEGLDAEQLAQVNTQLQDMAAPFKLEETNYQKLSADQLAQVEDVELKAKLTAEYTDYLVFYDEKPIFGNNIMDLNYGSLNEHLTVLKEKPNEVKALNKIKEYFEVSKQSRIANYFKGRILSL